jgi:hypothetical protein
MKNILQNLIGRPAGRNVLMLSLVVLLMLSTTPVMALGNPPSVVTNKNTYNIGDPIYVTGTATPNASVKITLLDPSNATVVAIQTQVASGGNYSTGRLYTLKVTDEAGNWSVVAVDTSSNMTGKASFGVVSVWDRISQLEDQNQKLNSTVVYLNDQLTYLSDQVVVLQNDTQTLNSTVGTLSSRLSAAEISSTFAYGAIVISILAVFVSYWAVRKKAGFIPKKRR